MSKKDVVDKYPIPGPLGLHDLDIFKAPLMERRTEKTVENQVQLPSIDKILQKSSKKQKQNVLENSVQNQDHQIKKIYGGARIQ